MKMLLWTLLGAIALATPSIAEDRRIRDLTGTYPTHGARRIELDLPPGEIKIEPSPDNRLRAELAVYCAFDESGCQERAHRLSLEAETDGNTLRFRVIGIASLNLRGLNVRGRLLVPRQLPLEVDLPAGELSIRGIQRDLDVDIGAGEVEIALRERDVRSVRVGVGIGEASLSVGGRSIDGSGWLGHKVRWGEGSGPSRVSVTLAVGEVDIRLD